MGENSKISWCHHTLNPWIGCQKVSPGCTHCYAEALDKRTGGAHWGVGSERRRTSEANWRTPLRWDRLAKLAGTRHRVFCASMADWLDGIPPSPDDHWLMPHRPGDIPARWLADLLALIEATPNLDWLLLTKRPEAWHDRLCAAWNIDSEKFPSGNLAYRWLHGEAPANVWVGTTVEDQARAAERVPALMRIPARVRFLSCEPLLEVVDLGPWLGDYDCHACHRRFWGDGVSGAVQVEFRCDSDCTVQDGTCGCTVHVCPHCGVDNGDSDEDGTVGPVSEYDPSDDDDVWDAANTQPHFERSFSQIHWIIAGGESGAAARPCNLDWIASLKEQAEHHGAAFFAKQTGARAYVRHNSPLHPLRWPAWSPQLHPWSSTGVLGDRLRPATAAGTDLDAFPPPLQLREYPRVA